jgi:hypothetical protein
MTIDLIRDFFLWCSIINIALLMVSLLIVCTMRSYVYREHGKWFSLTKEQFQLVWYAFIGFYKICIFVFNLVPFIVLSFIN